MTDWTDFARTNPELEATRERWNARFCEEVTPRPRTIRPFVFVTMVQFAVIALVVAGVWAVAVRIAA